MFKKIIRHFRKKKIKDHNSVIELNNFLFSTAIKTKKLLDEKKFSNSIIEERVFKSVLLGTEISELADAVKKGLGNNCEGEEIADIVIRSCNFLCSDETFEIFNSLTNKLNSLETSCSSVKLDNTFLNTGDTVKDKFIAIEKMMLVHIKIVENTRFFDDFNDKSDNEKNIEFLKLWSEILKITSMCSLYCESFLEYDIEFYTNKKMIKNLNRPIKYNSTGMSK